MPNRNQKPEGGKKSTLAKTDNTQLRLAKGLALPHARLKPKRGDKDVLADMGLLALLPDKIEPEADQPRPRPVPGKRRGGDQAAFRRGSDRRLERLRADPHKRPRAHILRVMEPGRCYVVNDVVRALAGVYGIGAVKAQMRFRMPRQGLIERVPAPPGMEHRGPLDHGSPQKDPIRWLYRLTQAGSEERQAVLARDAEVV